MKPVVLVLILILRIPLLCQPQENSNGVGSTYSLEIDSVITYSTFNSIGLEFWITGDSNCNSVNTRFTFNGGQDASDTTFYPLMRSYYKCPWPKGCYVDSVINKWAGSIMFLEPDSAYIINVEIVDPDGGGIDTTLTVRTRAYPSKTAVGTGRVGYRNFYSSGYYNLNGDTLTHINLYSDSVYIDNFYISNNDSSISPPEAIRNVSFQNLNNITIKNGVINGDYNRGIEVVGSNWYIDRVYISNGDCVEYDCRGDHTGILMGVSPSRNILPNGTVISNVEIDSVGDAIKFGFGGNHVSGYNIDIFSCVINNVGDDGIELDQLQSNVRVWGNKICKPGKNGISFQPQACGPWYILNNTIEGYQYESALKLVAVDGAFILNNTFSQTGVSDANTSDIAVIRNAQNLAKCYVKDNKFEFKGENRSSGLNSYILYGSEDGEFQEDWGMIQKENIYLKPENQRILDNNWSSPGSKK